MSVVAPFVTQAGRVEPYVSLNEVKFSPTASSLDFANLVANGSQTAQDRALYELIVRASSKIDVFCMGQYGTLNATLNNGNGRYRLDRYGRFKIHPDFAPVTEVTAFSWGPDMGSLYPVALTTSNCFIEPVEIIVVAQGASSVNLVSGMQALNYIARPVTDGEFYCQWTYVSGYANSFLSAQASAGATSIALNSVVGVYPGMFQTIWDGMNDEYVQVSPSYDGVSSTVPLVSPLQYTHGTNTNVSALPAAVKQACIHFVVAMVKQRGQGGIMLTETGADVAVSGKIEMSAEDEVAGYDLLDPFKVVWGRM